MDIGKEITYTVFCSRCGDMETYSESGGSPTKKAAERSFKRDGWKVVNNKTLCPECAELCKK